MSEYIKKETAINVLREVCDAYDGFGLNEGAEAVSAGINAIKAIEAEDVMPASNTALSINDRAKVERALGIIEGATAALRHDERYEGVEGMLITALEMIEYVINKGEYMLNKGE